MYVCVCGDDYRRSYDPVFEIPVFEINTQKTQTKVVPRNPGVPWKVPTAYTILELDIYYVVWGVANLFYNRIVVNEKGLWNSVIH